MYCSDTCTLINFHKCNKRFGSLVELQRLVLKVEIDADLSIVVNTTVAVILPLNLKR